MIYHQRSPNGKGNDDVLQIRRNFMNNYIEKNISIVGMDARVRGDGNFIFSLKDGPYEEPAFKIWCEYLGFDAVCIDVGANIGLTSIALARIASAGTVYAIEPDDTTFSNLISNLTANGVANAVPVQALLGVDGVEKVFLANEADPTGSTSITPNNTRASQQIQFHPQKKNCISIDRFCEERQISRLDFIKIDTEGAEIEVLRGARRMLSEHRPLVYMEFNSHCLMNFANVNPPQALEEIREIFPYI
jgi:FkbM family methyltransferase